MINKNIGILHNAIMTFKSIADLEKYKYISDIDTNSTVLLLGKETEGDAIIQQRKIVIENDEGMSGIQLFDGRWAILVGELIPVKKVQMAKVNSSLEPNNSIIEKNFLKNTNSIIKIDDLQLLDSIILLSPKGENTIPPSIFPCEVDCITIRLNTGELCEFYLDKNKKELSYNIKSEEVSIKEYGIQIILKYK